MRTSLGGATTASRNWLVRSSLGRRIASVGVDGEDSLTPYEPVAVYPLFLSSGINFVGALIGPREIDVVKLHNNYSARDSLT